MCPASLKRLHCRYTYYQHKVSGETSWTLPERIPGYKTTRQTMISGDPSHGTVCKGCSATLHATGQIAESGYQFWCTKDKDEPFTFNAGVGEVITGWDMGCLGMAVGETRVLQIPGEEGYGQAGFPVCWLLVYDHIRMMVID